VNKTRVLVVDDEVGFLDFMAGHLRRRGYEVESATDGQAAADILHTKDPFAVLVTDLTMPGMNGLELLRLARKHDPRLETIVITANDSLEVAIGAMREDGAYDYLLKPLPNNNDLSLAVERAAERRRMRLEYEALQSEMLTHANHLQALIASTDDAILSADAQDIITIINPATIHLFGREPLVGNHALTALPPIFANLITNWQTVLERKPALVEVAWGAHTTYRVGLTPLPADRDGARGWVMVVSDVTHFKRLEEFRLHMLNEAANKIQFPLFQALTTAAELNQMPESKSEKFTGSLYSLNRQLDQIRRWIEEVLVTARIEAGIGTQPDWINLAAVINEWAQAANKRLIRDTDLRINAAIETAIPKVYADRELMQRLLQHLFDQIAGHFQSTVGHQLNVTARPHREQVWINFSLDGPGLADAPADRPNLFRNTAQKASPDLASVTALANKMSGQVWVIDREPARNAIAIALPAAPTRTT